MQFNMDISLIVTTYNWPEALNKVLESIERQSHLPREVIIADDGSGQETAEVVAYWQQKLSIPVIHSWQEDEGYRLSASRNKAIARANGDYLVMIDGDMVLDRHFIRDHTRTAQPGYFIQGWRVRLNEQGNFHVFEHGVIPHCRMKGILDLKNRCYGLRLPVLRSLSYGSPTSISGTKGCNMAFWKQDVVAINGFNEDFVGWGKEDNEFATRMINRGIRRKRLRFSAVAFHLYHDESPRNMVACNHEILMRTKHHRLAFCHNGLSRYQAS